VEEQEIKTSVRDSEGPELQAKAIMEEIIQAAELQDYEKAEEAAALEHRQYQEMGHKLAQEVQEYLVL
jgi:hypothetical protein